jgi:multiple RNA-binding domain-containing protein 1
MVAQYVNQKERAEKFEKYKKLEENLRKTEEPVGESGRIFVRNLAYSTTEEEIEELFKEFGDLTEVNVPVNKHERRNMGIAFVTFMFPEHAAAAFAKLDGEIFQGRVLHLLPAKPARDVDKVQYKPLHFWQ